MDTKKIKKTIDRWQDFAKRNNISLNKDSKRVELLANGVLSNEDNTGFKYCPCRLNSGDEVADAKLICPCNFKSQKTWKEVDECWCSLFVK
jgi:ferredoxin-thioredoxin reductase catalytic subunit